MKKTLSTLAVGALLIGGTTFYASKNSGTKSLQDRTLAMLIPAGYENNPNWELLTSTNGRDWTIVPSSNYSITNNTLTVTNDDKGGMHYFRYWWYR